ncbi:UNVERIFIED_CONTAM: hypothetical protein PYX00_006208 [Menopon gallinae]|uniref:Uncharacterized protein n=1 Tax=Menopon gallinae TaxID=328185 RepID=A0AAW2HUK5_9NEOP
MIPADAFGRLNLSNSEFVISLSSILSSVTRKKVIFEVSTKYKGLGREACQRRSDRKEEGFRHGRKSSPETRPLPIYRSTTL